ncbi:hypothetical protein [Photorhabdus australis]|uniref:hypothetical protein n=1 Tax=Photorhabdus australis TaxID=286156 RepID=UPI0030DACF28
MLTIKCGPYRCGQQSWITFLHRYLCGSVISGIMPANLKRLAHSMNMRQRKVTPLLILPLGTELNE